MYPYYGRGYYGRGRGRGYIPYAAAAQAQQQAAYYHYLQQMLLLLLQQQQQQQQQQQAMLGRGHYPMTPPAGHGQPMLTPSSSTATTMGIPAPAISNPYDFLYDPFDAVPDSASRGETFIALHTSPFTNQSASSSRAPAPPNTDCPICLEGADEHECVRIKSIPGCEHMIGLKCLKDFLKNRPDDKKECPLCRALWLKEEGIWQDSEEFAALTGGGMGRGGMDGFGGWGAVG